VAPILLPTLWDEIVRVYDGHDIENNLCWALKRAFLNVNLQLGRGCEDGAWLGSFGPVKSEACMAC
jgi:hypothetical protein